MSNIINQNQTKMSKNEEKSPIMEKKKNNDHQLYNEVKKLMEQCQTLTMQIDELCDISTKKFEAFKRSMEKKMERFQERVTDSVADRLAQVEKRKEIEVKFIVPDVDEKTDIVVPKLATEGSAGFDICCTEIEYEPKTQTILMHTGLHVEIPEGYVGLLFMKSSVFRRTDRLTNAVGVIDSDYRGEIMARFECNTSAFLKNIEDESFWPFKRFGYVRKNSYKLGEAIMQMIIVPIPSVTFVEVDTLSATERDHKGFGGADNEN